MKKLKPKKILQRGLRPLAYLNPMLYARLKSAAKARAELTFIGEQKAEKVESQLFIYNEAAYTELPHDATCPDVDAPEYDQKVIWLNYYGLHDVSVFEALGKAVELDRFTLRQIVDTTLRPKAEEHEHYLFFSINSILSKEESLLIEHLSFILGKNYVISFQEKRGDHFDHIRHKIRENLGLIRKKESDYLLVQLLDAILDNYFETMDAINQEITEMEPDVLNNPTQQTLVKLEKAKKMTAAIKKSLKPFKEALAAILNDRTTFVSKGNKKYFRDLKNNCSSVIEEADASLAALESLTNIYFSSISQKMNEIMKVLTTVATIFIPLTFITGIYGMNFEHMPLLHNRHGFLLVFGGMFAALGVMIGYFKWRRWM